MNRPNIIYLHSHDTSWYVQPYRHAIPAPSLQRLAEEGIFFRQALRSNTGRVAAATHLRR